MSRRTFFGSDDTRSVPKRSPGYCEPGWFASPARTTVEDLPDLPRLLAALAAMGQIEPDYAIKGFGVSMPTLESVLPKSVFDRDQPQGLQAGVVNMVDKAAEVRDRISLDAYRIINRIGDNLVESGRGRGARPGSDDRTGQSIDYRLDRSFRTGQRGDDENSRMAIPAVGTTNRAGLPDLGIAGRDARQPDLRRTSAAGITACGRPTA